MSTQCVDILSRSEPIAARPLVSILVPVYNVADYIEACVTSIMSQIDGDDIELILLDDASTDASFALCQMLCQKYGSVITLMRHDENQGQSAARNRLLSESRGQYLWFIDSDDMILPGALADLRDIIITHAPEIIMCDYLHNGRVCASFAGKAHGLENDGEALVQGIFASRKMHIWTKISRRELWADNLRFPVGRAFEDVALTPWLHLKAKSYYYCARPWVFYRSHSASIMAQISRTKGVFDDQRNDDLAMALSGYNYDFHKQFPNPSAETLYATAHFCAKEFTKIVLRLIRNRVGQDSWHTISSKLCRYKGLMQDCSPLSFDQLSDEYLRRRMMMRWCEMKICLQLARQ